MVSLRTLFFFEILDGLVGDGAAGGVWLSVSVVGGHVEDTANFGRGYRQISIKNLLRD